MNCNYTHSKDCDCVGMVPIFQGMNNEEVKKLQRLISQENFAKGENIFIEGEHAEKLYVVENGLLKLSKISSEGKEQIIRLLVPGDTFGHSALQENGIHHVNAEALKSSTVCSIWKHDFFDAMGRNQSMSFRLISALNERLFQADEWISLLSLLEVEQRLARAILYLFDKIQPQDNTLKLPIQKRELASLIGTTPETLSRKLVVLVSENMIHLKDHKYIKIINDKKLKKWLDIGRPVWIRLQ